MVDYEIIVKELGSIKIFARAVVDEKTANDIIVLLKQKGKVFELRRR